MQNGRHRKVLLHVLRKPKRKPKLNETSFCDSEVTNFSPFLETSNGRLPIKHGPHSRQTLGNAFQTIPDVSFFNAENLFSRTFSDQKTVFRHFRPFSEELHQNGHRQQLPRHFLLQIDLFGAQYDPWSSSWNRVPSWDGLCKRHWPVPRGRCEPP